MEYCRNCGKATDNRKMMMNCECGGKLIGERQYKLEQKDKCNHILGREGNYKTLVRESDYEYEKLDNNFDTKFKYCPLCGNKTRFYTKENKYESLPSNSE